MIPRQVTTAVLTALAWTLALAAPLPQTAQAQDADKKAAPKHHHHPQIAISADADARGQIWITGVDRKGALYLRRVVANGKPVDGPTRRIDIAGDKVAAAGESRPKLLFGPNNWAVLSYTQPLSKPYTGEIRMLRSDDGGASFSKPFTVHQDRQIITHRFESVLFDEKGVLHTFWVDKRDLEAVQKEKNLSGREIAKFYRGAAIYRNESKDGGKTFGSDLKVADHSCECCRIALSTDNTGAPVALWRHVFEPNIRDHAFWTQRAPQLVRATFDDWRIDACPHHGPGLARDQQGGFHSVWFGIRGSEARVRYARLDAGGAPAEVRELPDAGAEHADVRSLNGKVVVSWRSFDGTQTVWKAWVSDDDGKTFKVRTLGTAAGDNDYPILVAKAGLGIWGLWNTAKELKIEKIVD